MLSFEERLIHIWFENSFQVITHRNNIEQTAHKLRMVTRLTVKGLKMVLMVAFLYWPQFSAFNPFQWHICIKDVNTGKTNTRGTLGGGINLYFHACLNITLKINFRCVYSSGICINVHNNCKIFIQGSFTNHHLKYCLTSPVLRDESMHVVYPLCVFLEIIVWLNLQLLLLLTLN